MRGLRWAIYGVLGVLLLAPLCATRAQVVGLVPTPIGMYTWNPVTQQSQYVTNNGSASAPLQNAPQAFTFYGFNTTLGQWTPCTSIAACFGGSSFDVNGTPLISAALVNYESGTGVTVTNPSAGNIVFTANLGGAPGGGGGGGSAALRSQIKPQLTVNQAFVTGTVFYCGFAPSVPVLCPESDFYGNSNATLTSVYSATTGVGSLGTVTRIGTVTGFTLPAGWSAANITAISGYAVSAGVVGPDDFSGLACNQPAHVGVNLEPVGVVSGEEWYMQAVATLSSFDPTALSAITCTSTSTDSGGAPQASYITAPLIGLILTDTIDPPIPPSTALQVDLPLSVGLDSTGTLALQYDTMTPVAAGWLVPTTIAKLPLVYAVPVGTYALVTDGTSSTDCTVGGGSTPVVCVDNGTIWTVGSLGSSSCTVAGNCPPLNNTALNAANTSGNLFIGDITTEHRMAIYEAGHLYLLQNIFGSYFDINLDGTDSFWIQPTSGQPVITIPGSAAYAFGSSGSGYGSPTYFLSQDSTTAGQWDVGTSLNASNSGFGFKWIGPNAAVPLTGSATGYPTGALAPAQNGQWAWNNGGTFQTLKMRVASADGYTTLSSGVSSAQSTTAACTPSSTCVYKFSNCGINSSTAVGVLEATGVSVGTSFTITAVNPASGATQTNDNSHVCWSIN